MNLQQKPAIITYFDPHRSLACAICADGSRCWLDRGLLCCPNTLAKDARCSCYPYS
jgi:hypothetical protein